MKRLQFIADDFGLSPAINGAILHAYREGALTGASLMMGQAETVQAVNLARAHPGLHVGWHLHLCDSQPATLGRWPWGASPVRAGLLLGLPAYRRRVRAEIAEQWRQFQATGLWCEFINCHHHLHLHPLVSRLMGEVTASTGAWSRGFNFRLFGG